MSFILLWALAICKGYPGVMEMAFEAQEVSFISSLTHLFIYSLKNISWMSAKAQVLGLMLDCFLFFYLILFLLWRYSSRLVGKNLLYPILLNIQEIAATPDYLLAQFS